MHVHVRKPREEQHFLVHPPELVQLAAEVKHKEADVENLQHQTELRKSQCEQRVRGGYHSAQDPPHTVSYHVLGGLVHCHLDGEELGTLHEVPIGEEFEQYTHHGD